ncbi:MAG: hypothetical protein HZA78_07915 [Candidatus Schekmanbacteria bacterium]|nr:hypothetical protein [Candidatus Schekmanbacteria bacterium]
MKAEIKKLIELQEVDKKNVDLQKKCAQLEKEIKELQTEIDKAQTEQKTAEDRLSETQKEHRRLERESEEKDVKIGKYKTQMLNLKTNKEYQAMQGEIKQEEAAKGALEESVIKALDLIEELQGKVKENKEKIKAIETNVGIQRKTKQDDLAQLQVQINAGLEVRTRIAGEISPRMIAEYTKLAQKRAGLAIAAVKNCTCQGCFINIPAQDYEELKVGDKIYFCSHCSRILYWYGAKQA